MKKLALFVCIATLASFLIGCGPIYKREYMFVPPKSNIAKMCTAQCLQGKNMCEQNCQISNDLCRSRAREDAYREYKIYKHDRERSGKSVDRDISSFDNGVFICNSSCKCESTYRACYSTCGGEVLQRDVCVAFCKGVDNSK